jgi:hypothetical protein
LRAAYLRGTHRGDARSRRGEPEHGMEASFAVARRGPGAAEPSKTTKAAAATAQNDALGCAALHRPGLDWLMPVLKNAKHEAVAQAYLADRERIGWRAYKGVYPKSSKHAAETAIARLLKNAGFAARIAELAAAAADDTVMSAREVLQELTKIARSNMADYMRADDCGDPHARFLGPDGATRRRRSSRGDGRGFSRQPRR